jgi:hypothetical protein
MPAAMSPLRIWSAPFAALRRSRSASRPTPKSIPIRLARMGRRCAEGESGRRAQRAPSRNSPSTSKCSCGLRDRAARAGLDIRSCPV